MYFYYQSAAIPPPDHLDRLHPLFIWGRLPPVVAGVVIAAILAAAMSNISAALNSPLASSSIMHFYIPWRAGEERLQAELLKNQRLSLFSGERFSLA